MNPNGTIVYTYNSIVGVSGKQHIQTNVTNLPNGIYIIRVTQNLSTAIKKFVLIK
ncbi:MAG: T9SS type A sorting domain-containing protein [Bacteroidetes bacterium]|nr:T9SS type A sorting domain-containing protein [Bacteroidota bacterium]